MGDFEDLVARATADPAVRGVVLTGSQARGMATVHSDHDVIVLVDERGGQWTRTRKTPALDEIVCTVDELADTSNFWERYAYRGARVLLDRLDGRIAALVQAQATPTEAEATAWSREYLDGYVNFVYRAAKNRRDGRPELARLEDMEAVPWFLMTLFPLYGRVRPYNKYLRWELETFPLDAPWDAASLPERVAEDPGALFADLSRVARERGHGDVLDAWGDELDLLRG